MDNPSSVQARDIAATAIFTAVILGSDFALAGIPNVKLLDVLVFVSSFLFGFRVGASVAILSELAWSFLSPWGAAGAIAPFLILGELLYATAGRVAHTLWKGRINIGSVYSLAVGSLLAICAFIWDFETNLGTALIATWPETSINAIIAYQIGGIGFAAAHEISDFVFGTLIAPAVISIFVRFSRRAS
jgi:hypothetical protein